MSFSSEVKNELVKTEYENICCQKALLYGMCIFGKSFTKSAVALQTENTNIAKQYRDLLKSLFNVKANLKKSPHGRNTTVSVLNENDIMKILNSFGHTGKGSLRIDHSNFDCENCRNAFVAGAFLSCGTISDPKKDYHLEFTIPYLNLSKSLFTLLDEAELGPKSAKRKGYNIIYFKGSESIEDCLYIMGASTAMFELMNVKIVKDFRNKANRQANCETANIERMVNAVAGQIDAINNIWNKKGNEFLPENLQEIAKLRIENPDSSLAELAEMCNPPLSRSGVNHRLKRIIQISEEL